MIASGLRLYFEAGLLLALSSALWWAARQALTAARCPTRPETSLRLARGLLLAALVLPLAVRLPLFQRPTHGPSIAARRWARVGPLRPVMDAGARSARGLARAWPEGSDDTLRRSLLGVVLLGSLVGLAGVGWRARRLRRHLRALPVLRRHRRVVLATVPEGVAYAARSRGRAWVVVPGPDWADRPRRQLVLAHEIQHHRQHDTRWAFGLQALAAVFFWNPGVRLWIRILTRQEEAACDAAVVGRRRLSPRDYARFLVESASVPLPLRRVPFASTAVSRPSLLRRRIEMLLDERTPRRAPLTLAAAACLAVLATGAVLAQPGEGSASISAEELRALVAARGSRFEVPANAVVLRELNRLLGTPRSRQQLDAGLARMAGRAPMIDTALRRAELPLELKAVPLVESGYRNFDSDPGVPESPRGAGLWMFIASTARRYELRVDDSRDDRLNPARETEAAARMLADLHREFGDWGLALAAYNQGEVAVRTAVDGAGTADAWTLIEGGRLAPYAGTVMAAVLVIENPELLRRDP